MHHKKVYSVKKQQTVVQDLILPSLEYFLTLILSLPAAEMLAFLSLRLDRLTGSSLESLARISQHQGPDADPQTSAYNPYSAINTLAPYVIPHQEIHK